MAHQTPPKQMAQRLARVLRPERPEYAYLTKVFQHTRALLAVTPATKGKRLPHLLTDRELVAFYEAVWQARNPTHMVMIKVLIFTGLRNAELARIYALAAGIQKRVYPHLFRHQIITFLTKKGIISPKLQLLSGHAEEKSLAMYRDLALADVSAEYEAAMQSFPVR